MSVLPCITEAILPTRESGPFVFKISLHTTKAEEHEIGLKIDKVKISFGKCKN